MSLSFDKIVFSPSVTLFASSQMNTEAVLEAVDSMYALEAAEKEGSPLHSLIGRIMNGSNGDDLAEFAGRQCYRSWLKGRDPETYHANIRSMGHGSIYEHASVSYQITGVSRSFSHEIVRHRPGTGFSQESQRYVDASDMRFVVPALLATSIEQELGRAPTCFEDIDSLSHVNRTAFKIFLENCEESIRRYVEIQPMLAELAQEVKRLALNDQKAAVSALKRANEAAREVLPNAAETRMVFTSNLRQLRHVMLMRGDEPADLQIRRIAVAMFPDAKAYAPHFFSDLVLTNGTDGLPMIDTNEARRV